MATLIANSLTSSTTGNVLANKFSLCGEETALKAAKRGHAAAFGELCERNWERLYRTVYRITRNREDAQDAVQEAFLSAHTHLNDFDERAQFSTWLTRIAINAALMILRKRRREVSVDGAEPEVANKWYLQIPDFRPSPEEHYFENERDELVSHAIDKLKPRLRQVVEVNQLGRRSLQDTAKILGISMAATKARLFRARAALRKMAVSQSVENRLRWAAKTNRKYQSSEKAWRGMAQA